MPFTPALKGRAFWHGYVNRGELEASTSPKLLYLQIIPSLIVGLGLKYQNFSTFPNMRVSQGEITVENEGQEEI
jgi:hypothetical protein